MKKYIIILFILTLMVTSMVQATPDIGIQKKLGAITTDQNINSFTHSVFAEECTATWCPNCPTASEALYNIYQSGEYPFYYVAHVDDMNPIAKERNKDFAGIIKIYAFPTVYFDGGDTSFIGRKSTVQQTENEYRKLIEQEGARNPRQPITMSSIVTWDGNSKLTITTTITNEGNRLYLGKIRSYVAEIESRWKDHSGDPYHFGFLDFAVNKFILLLPGRTITISGSFDGAADHGGQTYEDITSDNIIVISTISNWIPHFRVGYESTEYTQRYFAFYVDQSTAATPT
jgi:hypothetical protein